MNVERLERVSESLAARGVTLRWDETAADDAGVDGRVSVEFDGRRAEFPYESKSQLRPSTIPVLRSAPGSGAVIVSSHITTTVGQLLRDRGLHYADAAGNTFLTAPGLHIEIEGKRPKADRRPHQSGSLFTPAALPVILAILTEPKLAAAPLREIQDQTSVSIGTVFKVREVLRRRGIDDPLTESSGSGVRDRWRQLFEGWVAAYIERAPKTAVRFRSDLSPRQLKQALAGVDGTLSGEAAASVKGFDIRPASLDLYYRGKLGPIVKDLRLRRDPAGPVSVRSPIWAETMDAPTDRNRPNRLAPAPVIYADIAALNDPRADSLLKELRTHDSTLRPFFLG